MELVIVAAIGYLINGWSGAAWALVSIYLIVPVLWGLLARLAQELRNL